MLCMYLLGVVSLSHLLFLSNDTLSFVHRATLHLTSSSSLLWIFISSPYIAFSYSSVLISWSPYNYYVIIFIFILYLCTHHHTLLAYTNIVQIQHILDFLVLLTFLSNIRIIACFWTISCKMTILTTNKTLDF